MERPARLTDIDLEQLSDEQLVRFLDNFGLRLAQQEGDLVAKVRQWVDFAAEALERGAVTAEQVRDELSDVFVTLDAYARGVRVEA